MKKNNFLNLIILANIFLFTGCGFHNGNMQNLNSTLTSVELSKKNFKVLSKVDGISQATYILGIGGTSNKGLIARAKNDMFERANIIGTSKAFINITMEKHSTLFIPFYFRKTVIVTGYVIEFTE